MILADLRPSLSDRLAEIEDWLAGVTMLEWVLLALAVAAIVWVVAMVRAATRLGPIEVAKLESDSDGAALTARMRQAIDHVGFRPPPSVPSGAPQADLLSAIEKSPVPQANWIASLIALIPWPKRRSYRLTTTIVEDGWKTAYWLQPLGPGRAKLDTVDEDIDPALTTIPRQVLMHVSEDAPDLFPAWSQWRRAEALEAYLQGLVATDDTARHRAFAEATARQPDNAIGWLRLFNVREKIATAAGSPQLQAKVLRSYLDLVMMHPELVEARFRASSLAGVVAQSYAAGDVPARRELRAALRMRLEPPG